MEAIREAGLPSAVSNTAGTFVCNHLMYGVLYTLAKNYPNIKGGYSCKGYDTFGPFKLIGGLAKGHPDASELEEARKFFEKLYKGL